METGWTERAQVTQSYMRFNGRGAVQIATTVAAPDRCECMLCGARLPWAPVELMRAA